jgi:hypothetical protein
MWEPKVIQVIEAWKLRGKGTDDDLMRRVRQIYSLDGNYLLNKTQLEEKMTKPRCKCWDYYSGDYRVGRFVWDKEYDMYCRFCGKKAIKEL